MILDEWGVATLERPVAPRCLKLRSVSLVSTQLLGQPTSTDSRLRFAPQKWSLESLEYTVKSLVTAELPAKQLSNWQGCGSESSCSDQRGVWWFVKVKKLIALLKSQKSPQYCDNTWCFSVFREFEKVVLLGAGLQLFVLDWSWPQWFDHAVTEKRTWFDMLSSSGNIPLSHWQNVLHYITRVEQQCSTSLTHLWHILVYCAKCDRALQLFLAQEALWLARWGLHGRRKHKKKLHWLYVSNVKLLIKIWWTKQHTWWDSG